jgi:hypothetical protein
VEGLRKTTTKLRIVGLPAEIWTHDLPNTKQECWRLDRDVQSFLW